MPAFKALFGKFTSKLVVTLMKGCFAARLEDPCLKMACNASLERRGVAAP